MCELCLFQAHNWAHRLGRGQGGPWEPANGLLLCGSGSTGCHGWTTLNPTAAALGGWRIENGEHYETVSAYLLRPWPAWWFLDNDGCFTLDPDKVAPPAEMPPGMASALRRMGVVLSRA
jgi:hypothetical protein